MSKPLNILFGGDLSFSGIFKTKVNGHHAIFSNAVARTLKEADFVVTNLEGPVSAQPLAAHSAVDLRQPVHSIDYLKRYCTPVFNLANNHSLDCGLSGLRETKQHIKSAAVRSLGDGDAIVYLSGGGMRIALIAALFPGEYEKGTQAADLFMTIDSRRFSRQIQKAAANADKVIVQVHGGEEFTRFPSPRRRKRLRQLAALKEVDIVIAHHSHVFQGVEEENGTLLFYSLGNFVFHLEKHRSFPATHKSALLHFQFTKDNVRYSLLPIETDLDAGLIKSASADFLEEIEQRSDFSAYYRSWMREAYAVIYSGQKPLRTQSEPGLKNRSLFQLLFSGNFYARSFSIMRDAQKRSIYLSALLYRFLKKTGLIN